VQKLVISLILLGWVNISTAAPLNKFVAPPEDEPSVVQRTYMQQQTPSQMIQQRPPAPITPPAQTIAPSETLSLKQHWERLRLQKVEEQTRKMVNRLKSKMQTLKLQDKMKWHKKFKKKYEKAKDNGQTLATNYYQKLLDVSEQLIGQDIIKGHEK